MRLSDPDVRMAVYRSFKGICFWTRQPLAFEEMHLDHVWPRVKGGPDNLFNLVPTTQSMNLFKSAAFDPEATTAVLAIIRLRYGPSCLRFLDQLKARAPTQRHLQAQLRAQLRAQETLARDYAEAMLRAKWDDIQARRRTTILAQLENPSLNWWYVSDEFIGPKRVFESTFTPLLLIERVENIRIEIAQVFRARGAFWRDAGAWLQFSCVLEDAGIRHMDDKKIESGDFRRAWKSTVLAKRNRSAV